MADKKYVTLSEEAIEKMCGLIRESYSVADAIDDENIAGNSAYSSQKIEELLSDIDADTVNNHTVKSDVPENAVFTDTIYDDTDIKAEIAKKADATAIPSKVSVLENDSKYQTESDVTITLTDYATKTYVGEQITNAEHLKREIVTVLPSDTEASDNIIYMLKVESTTGNDKYQEYMKIDGTVQMVGDTSVDLTDYAKTVDIPTTVAELSDSGDYAKTADVNDSISTLQTDKANASDLTAHTDDADIHVTADDKTLWNTVDDKVDKISILTALDNYATDNQVYSAKALNTELDGVVKKTDIVDNLTSTDTDKPLSANQGKILNDTKLNKTDANKLNCVTIDNVSLKEYILTNFTGTDKTYYLIAKTTCTDLPKASNFYITVEMPGMYTYKVTAKELNDSNGRYVCTYRTISSSWTKWEKVCTTTVADVSKTTLTPVFPSEVVVDSGGMGIDYVVRNGWCNVNFVFNVTSATAFSWTDIATGLPKPANSVDIVLMNTGGELNRPIVIKINPTGSVSSRVPVEISATDWWVGNISYPVAES